MEDKYSLRKAWVEEEAVWRKTLEIVCDGGKIVEIAREKHRWRRDAGRDGRCGSEIRKEKWKERYGGKIVEIACEKHRWIRDAGRDGCCGWEIGWEKWKERYGGQIVEIA